LCPQPFSLQCLIEATPIGKLGQPILGGERLQGHFRALLVGHVA
jgi:hypothetical protein